MVTGSPRVLVLCQNNIQPFTGGGVVLSNLFHAFPADSVLFFHRDIDYNYQTSYPAHKLVWAWLRPNFSTFIRLLFRWVVGSAKQPLQVGRRDLPALFAQSCRFRFSREMDAEIRRFRPEVIYAWVGDSLWAETLRETARRYSLPYVIHFMDNHVGIDPRTPLERALYLVFRGNLDRVAKGAAAIYTISESMGVAYQALWNRPCEVFHGLLDTATWPWPGERKTDGIFTLVFTGSVEQGQLLGLRDVASAVGQLAKGGMAVRLVLYLTEQYERMVAREFAAFPQVEIRRHPEFAGLRMALAEADLLVLAYGFDERTIRYYRYSFATKVVPYMLSGRCILVYGPDEIEPVAYAMRGGWAATVSNPGIPGLMETIGTLAAVPRERERLAREAYDAGCREHDLAENSVRFARSLSMVARKNPSG